MPRPIMLGIVGDSGSGKTTITRGLVRVLGEDQVTAFCTDDYHRYDRKQRAERNITPLHPDCNYLDILAQHLAPPAEQRGDHEAGLPAHRRHVRPARVLRPEALRRHRGPARASTRRSCARCSTCASTSTRPRSSAATGRCSATARAAGTRPTRCSRELDRREPDSEAFIRPQRHHADIVVAFQPGADGRPGAPRREADAARLAHASRPERRRRRRRPRTGSSSPSARARRSSASRAGSPPERAVAARGGDLGEDALRAPPAPAGARRVHDRHRAPPLRLARARPAPDPVPRADRAAPSSRSAPARPADFDPAALEELLSSADPAS